jgi:hypothetical protein
MNFIVKLFKFKDLSIEIEYNLILSITEKMIKYTYFIFFKKATSASELAHIIMRTVIVSHKLSEKWIINRDIKFISQFWTTLIKWLKVKNKSSTVYHSQMNELIERLNQTMKQYF